MALGLTQPLTEMSTRNISWVRGGLCVGLTTLLTSCADCLEIWEPQSPGTLRACPGVYRDCVALYCRQQMLSFVIYLVHLSGKLPEAKFQVFMVMSLKIKIF
jgi:hypothetical protein